ncbi:MAG: GatB/YqeY domain-containing protein [Chloroflexi bacterium]|nr:GatB/YqeY domain-containing protein [Chloroflexota bacterium]
MSLKETIETELKNAMRAGDETRKTALRSIIAGIKLAAVEQRGTDLTDDDVQNIVRKEIKAQREALADAQKASRPDLVAQSEALIAVLETFLPKQLSRAEISAEAKAVMAEVGATGPADMGKVMKVLQPKVKGLADSKLVGDVVKELLAQK